MIQPLNKSGDKSAGSGDSKASADGLAAAKQQEQDDDMTDKGLSGEEMEVALVNGEDKAVVTARKKRVKRSLL